MSCSVISIKLNQKVVVIMLRHKYKFSKNHGLLQPKFNQKHPSSLITSLALVTRNDSQNYQVHRSPNNQNIIMLFNDKQYLHRQCTAVIDTAQQNVPEELSKNLKLSENSLTIYVTNNHDLTTANIIGDSHKKDGLIWQCLDKIKEQQSQNSYLSLSIVGIQNQNDLTDLLAVQMESDQPTSSFTTSSFQRRKLKINKSEGKWQPTNAQIELLQTHQDLSEALQRYKQIKNAIQYTAIMSSPKWDWLQGEIYILSQIQIDEPSQTILRTLKTHYILRINQYLRSVSSIMLKLGIQIRKMQENLSKSVTQNNESKVFRLINHCFCKNNDGLSYKYHTNLILEIGHYATLKEEYQNLVPTSELQSQRASLRQDKIQNASFLYLKHYEEYPSLVSLLGKVANNIVEKELNSVIEPKDSKKMDYAMRAKTKSYVYDTYSSIQKKNIRKQWMIEDFKNSDPQLIDVEEFVRKTAKLYRNEDEKQEGNQFKRVNKSSFKHYEKKSQNRSSSLDWNSKRQNYNQAPKVYISRNQPSKTNKIHQDMRSISYLIDNKFQRSKQINSSNLETAYGTHIRKNRALQKLWKPRTDLSKISQIKGRKQKDSRDDFMLKQIIELRKQDNFLNQKGSGIDQILQ